MKGEVSSRDFSALYLRHPATMCLIALDLTPFPSVSVRPSGAVVCSPCPVRRHAGLLGVDPVTKLLAEPIRHRLAAARQPAAATVCLRRLLAAAGTTPQQLERLNSPAATEPVKGVERGTATAAAVTEDRRRT